MAINLLDENMNKKIARCFINEVRRSVNKIHVIYEDGSRENIWTYNPYQYDFNHNVFIGMDKLQAVYYCDNKKSIRHEKHHSMYNY